MKKYLFSFIFALISFMSFTSCETMVYATTQDDIYIEETDADIVRNTNVDFNVIIRYGTPYYYNGSLLYYIYNNLYYYPFYYNDYWYVRVYRRPFNHLRYRPYFRPTRHDYRFRPGTYPSFNRPNINRRNTFNHRRPQMRMPDSQPNRSIPQNRVNPRSNVGVPHTPQSTNRIPRTNSNGRFGGSRR